MLCTMFASWKSYTKRDERYEKQTNPTFRHTSQAKNTHLGIAKTWYGTYSTDIVSLQYYCMYCKTVIKTQADS